VPKIINQKPVKYTPWFPVQKTLGSYMEFTIGKYSTWAPMKEMLGEYQITEFMHTFDGLTIYLSKCEADKDTRLKVYFPGADVVCRTLNETYTGKFNRSWKELFKDIRPIGPLFKVENSEYMKMLSEESDELIDMLDFKHYAILDSEWTFDIASQCQPQVELFIENKLVEKLEHKYHFYQKREKSGA
jgi:hypothetical protein